MIWSRQPVRWEYKFLAMKLADPDNDVYLNALGAEGWEAVAIVPNVDGQWQVHTAVLKRPITGR